VRLYAGGVPAFVDEAQVHVRGGDGGAGAVSFRREAHVSRGGPDGGDGGPGGSVWLEASPRVVSLLAFRDHPHRRAGDGSHGRGKGRHGGRGRDLVVPVPVGTVVRSLDGEVMADLGSPGDRLLAAEGGRGGRGNARFLSNRLRAPSFAEQGEVGEERWLDLELKLMADVALVGLPNAGKSTLISRVSAARPRIADYPFTTLEPHLGVVRVGGEGPDGTELVMADIPGLIEGASQGRGLGHRFLRHVERARVIVLLLDLSLGEAGPGPLDQERILTEELSRYQPELADRPRLVVGSKADLAEAPPGLASVSAVTGAGLDRFLREVAALVVGSRAAEEAGQRVKPGAVVVHRPRPEGVEVVRAPDGGWEVLGRPARRAVALNDLTDPAALAQAQRRLRHLGVDRALARAGAKEGDLVRVGDLAFTWEPDHS